VTLHLEKDSGTMLIEMIMVLSLFPLLLVLVTGGVQTVRTLRNTANLKAQALSLAVSTMESVKGGENPPSREEREGLVISWHTEEFKPSLLLLEVSVAKGDGQKILTLRTLKKQRILSP
jgi:type II secretory pathway pseudopilin PulG